MDRREKVEFILEQMRLNYERRDLAKMAIVSKKVNTKIFDNPKHADLKLRYYELMVQYALEEDKFLDICRYYREIYDTEVVKKDETRRKEVMRNVVVFLALSKYDNEQSDLMARVEAGEGLEEVPEHRGLLKCFTTPELMRWPGIEELYGPILRQSPVFSSTSSSVQEQGKKSHDGPHRWNNSTNASSNTTSASSRPTTPASPSPASHSSSTSPPPPPSPRSQTSSRAAPSTPRWTDLPEWSTSRSARATPTCSTSGVGT